MVRKHDPDRFLLSLFFSAPRREALWALYAFNHEIARTRELVTETQLGLIRLQWWRDALTAIYEGRAPPKHQVVTPLAEAVKTYQLPRETLEGLLFAREFDLEDRAPATLDGMANYADFTSSPLVNLALRIEGATMPGDEVISAAGTAYALAGLLRAVPAHARQRRCYLPEQLLTEAGTDIYDLYEGKKLEKLTPVVKTVAELAKKRLAGVPETARGHLALVQKISGIYLRQIEGASFNVFSPRLQTPPPFLALRLWWGHRA